MENQVLKHSEVKAGDVLLMAKMANLTVIHVLGITKSGSIKYTMGDDPSKEYYGRGLQFDIQNHDKKVRYLKKGWTPDPNKPSQYDNYFILIHRP